MEPATVGAAAAATSAILKIIQHTFAYTEVPDDVRAFQSSIESFTATLNTTRRLRRVKSHLLDAREKVEIDDNIRRGNEILDTISNTIESCRKDLSSKGTVGVRNRLVWLVRNQHSFMSRTHTLRVCHSNLTCDINCMRLLGGGSGVVLKPSSCETLEVERDIEGTFRPPSRRKFSSPPKLSPSDLEGGLGQEGKGRPWVSVSTLGNTSSESLKNPDWESLSDLSRQTSRDPPEKSLWKLPPEERRQDSPWKLSRESLREEFVGKDNKEKEANKQKEEYQINMYELEDNSSWDGSTLRSLGLESTRSLGTLSPPPNFNIGSKRSLETLSPPPNLNFGSTRSFETTSMASNVEIEPDLEMYYRPAVGDYAVDHDEYEQTGQQRWPSMARRKVRKSFMIT